MTGNIRSRSFIFVSALLLIWTVLWCATWPVGDFPLNDDWVYGLAVRSLLQTGRFSLPSPSASNLFSQAYWGALFCLPFGFSFTALRISTFVIGGFGLVAMFGLLRELGARRLTASAAALCLAVNPLYLQLATTFMTDVPFTAVSAGSLWLYVRGTNRGSLGAVAGAYALAIAAILIRQFGLVLPFSFAVAHLARRGFGVRALASALLPLAFCLAVHLAFENWIVSTGRTLLLPAPLLQMLPKSVFAFLHRAVELAMPALPYIGLFCAPFLLHLMSIGRGLRSSRASLLAGCVLTAVLLAAIVRMEVSLPALGNMLMPTGLGSLSLHDTYQLGVNLPPVSAALKAFWIVLTILGTWVVAVITVSTVAWLSAMARDMRAVRGYWQEVLLISLAAAYFAGLVMLGVSNGTFFDRYLTFLMVPVCGLAFLQREPTSASGGWHSIPGALCLVVVALLSVAATHDYLAWNRARWQMTDQLMRSGVTAGHIDGGYEFNGWNLYDTPLYLDQVKVSNWYTADDLFVITSGPLEGYETFAHADFNRWISMSRGRVFALSRKPKP